MTCPYLIDFTFYFPLALNSQSIIIKGFLRLRVKRVYCCNWQSLNPEILGFWPPNSPAVWYLNLASWLQKAMALLGKKQSIFDQTMLGPNQMMQQSFLNQECAQISVDNHDLFNQEKSSAQGCKTEVPVIPRKWSTTRLVEANNVQTLQSQKEKEKASHLPCSGRVMRERETVCCWFLKGEKGGAAWESELMYGSSKSRAKKEMIVERKRIVVQAG